MAQTSVKPPWISHRSQINLSSSCEETFIITSKFVELRWNQPNIIQIQKLKALLENNVKLI